MNAFRRIAPVLALALGLAIAACKKDPPPVPDAGPPPAPSPAPTASALTDLQPMEPEDAGVDSGVDAGKKPTGPAVNPNVAKLKQCCAAIGAEAKRNAATVEGGMMAAAAVQCNILASQAGASGNSPEITAVKNAMKGRALPAVCAGL